MPEIQEIEMSFYLPKFYNSPTVCWNHHVDQSSLFVESEPFEPNDSEQENWQNENLNGTEKHCC